MYRMSLKGHEALSWSYLESLVKALELCIGVQLLYARARDIEEGEPWGPILAQAAA